jgi:hypothetical protein
MRFNQHGEACHAIHAISVIAVEIGHDEATRKQRKAMSCALFETVAGGVLAGLGIWPATEDWAAVLIQRNRNITQARVCRRCFMESASYGIVWKRRPAGLRI